MLLIDIAKHIDIEYTIQLFVGGKFKTTCHKLELFTIAKKHRNWNVQFLQIREDTKAVKICVREV